MKAISFILSGKTAMFKKPDVNSYLYVTYNNIHKPALLGLLGAIIGLGGYTKLHTKKELLKEKIKGLKGKEKRVFQGELKQLDKEYPEFYKKLKDLKVSITPIAPHGYFAKKVQVFNNSVGYASKEIGGNLIVREQWLENPKWRIMILDDESEVYEKLKKYLIKRKSIYIPYLGKNDHPANIEEVEEIEFANELFIEKGNYVDSLFIQNCAIDGFEKEGEIPFIFREVSPVGLQEDFHFYEYQTICFTNCELEKMPNATYSLNQKNYVFY